MIPGGHILNVGIARLFWGQSVGGARAALTSSGYQEAMILVKGRYSRTFSSSSMVDRSVQVWA